EAQIAGINRYLSKKWSLASSVDSDGDGIADATDATPAGVILEPKPASLKVVFKDLAGNFGTAVTQTTEGISVDIDTTDPKLLDVSIVSNNLDNTTARKDDQVTLSFKTTEPIQIPTDSEISITGLGPLSFNQTDTEGYEWEVSGTVLASQNGNASFSIEVLDLAGNKGSPVTATDDNTSVVLDTTIPTLSDISLVSNNANDSQAFAKPGDNITLSFNSSEPIQIPSITLANKNARNVVDLSLVRNWEKLSNNHPDQDSASELACFDVSSLEEAKETCANQQDCNGFWRYDA
ncbi:MAG: hypothetical protein QF457_12015, partial [SAR324 cluster bacterium]|nr:hypothetical protein [SAR324 cluster bacterium]